MEPLRQIWLAKSGSYVFYQDENWVDAGAGFSVLVEHLRVMLEGRGMELRDSDASIFLLHTWHRTMRQYSKQKGQSTLQSLKNHKGGIAVTFRGLFHVYCEPLGLGSCLSDGYNMYALIHTIQRVP